MPSKKKKYNARFPAGRIKKIMQTDEDVGKVAQAVPVIISRTLELFVESLLKKAEQITSAKNAKTLTPSHMKQCILSEKRFDFLKDLVKGIPDVSSTEDESGSFVGTATMGANTSRAKSPTRYSRFQFRRKSDGGVSKPSATITTSQPSAISQPVLPRFYNEIEIGGDDSKKEEVEPAPSRTPVIQHTGPRVNHVPPVIPSYSEYIKSHTLLKSMGPTSDTAQTSGAKNTNYILSGKRKLSSDEDEDDDDDADADADVDADAEAEADADADADDDGDEDEDDYEENGYHRLEIVTKPCAVDEDYDA